MFVTVVLIGGKLDGHRKEINRDMIGRPIRFDHCVKPFTVREPGVYETITYAPFPFVADGERHTLYAAEHMTAPEVLAALLAGYRTGRNDL